MQALVIEDNQASAELLRIHLESAGFQVQWAPDAATALDLARQQPPDLITLDLLLPDATGWELARWLETLVAPPPIVVISGRTPDRKAMEHFHPVAFLLKPFAISELLDTVRVQLPLAGVM